MNALLQIIIVCPDKGVAEVPGILSKNIIYSSVLMCFQHTTTIIWVNPSKNNSTESHILLEPIQIPPAINRISLPSQSTAPEESLTPIFVTLVAAV